MPSLLPYAQDLAKFPPVDVYKRVMKSYAKSSGDEAAATLWDDQVKLYQEDGATFAVAAICDMTAMCMMMTAAGVARIEKMKSAILTEVQAGRKKAGMVFEDLQTGDRVYFYDKYNQFHDFEAALTRWCLLKDNGIVQFKFDTPGGWHTFVLERVWLNDKEPSFVVYQSYQNTYRLIDFLQGPSKGFEAQMKRVWDDFPKKATKCASLADFIKSAQNANEEALKKQWENFSIGGTGCKTLEEFTQKSIQRTAETVKGLGGGSPLDLKYTQQRLIEPLTQLVARKLPLADYVFMTASTATNQIVGAPFMAMLMCDSVSPGAFNANYTELLKSDAVTIYPQLIP